MAATPKTPPQKAAPDVLGGGAFATFAQEYDEDRKKLRWAIIIAAILHVIILFVPLVGMTGVWIGYGRNACFIISTVTLSSKGSRNLYLPWLLCISSTISRRFSLILISEI